MSDHLTELEARIEQARADYDAIQGYEESSLTERIALQHAAERVYPLTNELEVLIGVVREIEARHRPVHPDWVRAGDRICEECTDAAAYAAGVSYVAWPCSTAAAVQKLGGS